METAPGGSPVGVDDPYHHVDKCDFVTDEGRCRWAREHGHNDPAFADARSAEQFRCPVVAETDDDWEWRDCPHFRCRNHNRDCQRCGITQRRMAHDDSRPLLEEHHLSYRDTNTDGELSHEITVFLCRWCHAKVHNSWARIDDDATPDPDALTQQEQRRSKEQSELEFQSAADRYNDDDTTP